MPSSDPADAVDTPISVEQLRVLAALHGDIDPDEEDLLLLDREWFLGPPTTAA
ncbi:MAG: hypothetical protein IVW52_18910 [Acidimicrobiales bacterium]|nr:hypothetical protein [Acidimicrobiales bacterium]